MDENKFCNRVVHKFCYDVELTFYSFLSKFTYSKNLKTGTIHLNYKGHESLNLLHVSRCEMLHFVTSCMKQNKSRKQTLGSVQYGLEISFKRPSHGKPKLANSCWQSQVGVCERHKNSRQTSFYLTPTVCKLVCRLFLCRSHTPTWVCQHEFANLSLPCEGRFRAL